jgi:hypothetical protein
MRASGGAVRNNGCVARRNRRAPVDAPELKNPEAYGVTRTDDWNGEDWSVRTITGSSSNKTYRCPGCDQEIRPATPHVVAWPADDPSGVEHRRHWHTPCWNARNRRGPRTQRGTGAPRY